VQRDALRELLEPAPKGAVSRHSNRGLPRRHGRRARRGGQVARFTNERSAAAELLGIDQRQENGTAPASLLRVAPVARQRACDGFEQDTKRKPFVAKVGATERIKRASLVIDERPRIVARMAIAVDDPSARAGAPRPLQRAHIPRLRSSTR
jgi:hypothetical protein